MTKEELIRRKLRSYSDDQIRGLYKCANNPTEMAIVQAAEGGSDADARAILTLINAEYARRFQWPPFECPSGYRCVTADECTHWDYED